MREASSGGLHCCDHNPDIDRMGSMNIQIHQYQPKSMDISLVVAMNEVHEAVTEETRNERLVTMAIMRI
jgi:hypothetical protein